MFSGDTDDKARAAQIAALRRLGPSGRVRVAAEMSEDARRIAIEGEQRRHPELSASEARWVVLGRVWGPELASVVVPPSAAARFLRERCSRNAADDPRSGRAGDADMTAKLVFVSAGAWRDRNPTGPSSRSSPLRLDVTRGCLARTVELSRNSAGRSHWIASRQLHPHG
jgi:hypothetical protein